MIFWIVDRVGYALFQKSKKLGTVKSILIIRRDALGDMLYTLPAIRALAKAFPDARVTLLAHPHHKELISREKGINVIFSIGELRERKYDLAIDFKGHIVSILLMVFAGAKFRVGYSDIGLGFLLHRVTVRVFNQHIAMQNMKLIQLLGIQSELDVSVPVRKSDREQVSQHIKHHTIAVHTDAGVLYKTWPKKNFDELIIWIQGNFDAHVVTILPGKLDIFELAAFLEACVLFIGNSSFPGHLAAVMGTPTITLFHDGDAESVWKPIGSIARVILPDHPISGRGLGPATRDRMEMISVEKVKRVVSQTLQDLGVPRKISS